MRSAGRQEANAAAAMAVRLRASPCQTPARCLPACWACGHQHHIIAVLRPLCPFLSFSDSWLDMSRAKRRQPLPSISKGHKAEHRARANAFPFSARRANICSPLLQHPRVCRLCGRHWQRLLNASLDGSSFPVQSTCPTPLPQHF